MTTRRDTLTTLAGAAVVGSLSGCVRFASRRTSHFHGTPAMVQSESRGGLAGTASNDGYLATAVGVEGRTTVERFGVTKEIVAHSWGLRYTSLDHIFKGRSVPATVATFSTPSVSIAGQELNPITDLTIQEIGSEFLSAAGYDPEADDPWTMRTVDDATGKKVLRAFRDALGGDEQASVTFTRGWPQRWETATPDWNGDTHSATLSTQDPASIERSLELRFETHDGDFVVLFGAADDSTPLREVVADAEIDARQAPWTVRPDPPEATGPTVIHPPEDQFGEDALEVYLSDTNLRGARGTVEQGRKLIDETQELLATASNETRSEENETFRVVSDTRDDVKEIDTIMGGLGEDLQAAIDAPIRTTGFEVAVDDAREKSRTAAEIANRAHERVATHNDTRDEEDDRFVAIERNLGTVERLARSADQVLKKSGVRE